MYEITQEFKDFLTELPKCEHHLHLEGTLEPDLLFKLAKRNNIIFPEWFPKSIDDCNIRYSQFSDLQDFLDHYYVGMSVLIQEQDFYDLAMAYFTKAHLDNCQHSEVFFDPQGHTSRGVAIEHVVNGFSKACKDATAQYGNTNKLIMCLLRHLPPKECLEAVTLVEPYFQQRIIHGLGLDSSEVPNHPELFVDSYNYVQSKHPHVQLTAHAGEEGDHTYVSRSLDHLNVTRIDHGINSHQNDQLMTRLASEKVLLSICPLSNVKLQVVNHVGQLPIDKFFDQGIMFSINSDDPAYFGGYILDNYLEVHRHFGFTVENWGIIAKNSINGSWCDDSRKDVLLKNVTDIVEKYKTITPVSA